MIKNNKIFFCIFLSLFFQNTGYSQHLEAYNEGMRNLNRGDLETAISHFKRSVDINNRFADAWYYLGITFGYQNKYEESAYSFSRLESVNPNYDPTFYFEASKAYIQLSQFDKAEDQILKYINKIPKGPKHAMKEHMGKYRLEYIRKSPQIRSAAPVTDTPVPVKEANSDAGDYMPQVSPTGTRLYFTSVRKGGFDRQDDSTRNHYGEDVYVSDFKDGAWKTPELLPPPINSIADDFGSTFTGDGQTMIYVRCEDPDGIGSCDLYITQLIGTQWTEPQNLGNVVNSEEWESQPTVSSDGNRIIFTSIRKAGYGGTDIYMSEKNHLGDWGIPQNLGSIINTPFNDTSPFLAPDGKTLYFTSEGHPGFGGMDIFYSILENGKWSKPVNMGAPLNSSGDETNFSISASGKGYFASSRLEKDNYDLYEIELPDHLKPKPSVVVQGIVSNSKSQTPIGAVVLVEDLNSGELLAVNKSNSSTGEYLVVLPAGRDYSVSVSSDGFFFFSESFVLPKDTTYYDITMNIPLEPIEKGAKVVLNNIFFEVGKAGLKPISYVELNKAVDLMKKNPSMNIEIGGHTDNVGADATNLKLSEDRAKAVKEYMVLAGIEENRLIAVGYGRTQPIADNGTADGRASNRRTEFVIIAY